MTDDHKEAIRQGRLQANVVNAYLESLQSRQRRYSDPAVLKRRLQRLEDKLSAEANPLKALELRQQRLELERRLRSTSDDPGSDELEAQFIKIAREFSDRKGLSYAAWREMGVPTKVLYAAGLRR